jgi:ABC-2 type transport system permease protein
MTGWPAPAPGAARLPQMIAAQAGLEVRTLVRNGEQLLLTLIIPVLLLVVFSSESLINTGRGSRIGFIAPWPCSPPRSRAWPSGPGSSAATAC